MIYLDHNATTPLDERVVEAMQPFLSRFYGNPSALHRWGRVCRDAIEQARAQLAALVKVQPQQIIFTSGGTEANNLAIQGWCLANPKSSLAVSPIEHPSVRDTVKAMEKRGHALHWLQVDAQGRVQGDGLVKWCSGVENGFVSCMLANNETGVVQPVKALVRLLAGGSNIVFHTDAVQAAGRLELDFEGLGVNLLTLSAHKIHGPKGVGALVVDPSVTLVPLLYGGGQERGMRPGTENVAGIVGFGKAAEILQQEGRKVSEHCLRLRRLLEAGLEKIPGVTLLAREAERLANTVSFSVSGMDGEMLVMALDREKVAVSSGSSCASGKAEPSHVLMAMGLTPDIARGAVRVSLGKDNCRQEIERFLIILRNLLGHG